MKTRLILLASLIFVAACSSPTDIVFGPEPLKQMQEQGEKFSKLPKEDRELLVGYIALAELGKAFAPADAIVVTGKTVGEVLEEAKEWRAKAQAAEAEQKRLKEEEEARQAALAEKIRRENEAIVQKIQESMTFAITNSKVVGKNYNAGRYSDLFVMTYAVENKSEKDIAQIKGTARFTDLAGEELGTLNIDFDKKVGAKKTVTSDLDKGWRVNEFIDGTIKKVSMREFGQMKIVFEPEVVVFTDGETLKIASK